MSFAKFLIAKLRARNPSYDGLHGLPIKVVEGAHYSTLTGSDPPTAEIDWDALQRQIEELEQEYAERNKP